MVWNPQLSTNTEVAHQRRSVNGPQKSKKRPRTVSMFTLMMSHLTTEVKGKSLETSSLLVFCQTTNHKEGNVARYPGGGEEGVSNAISMANASFIPTDGLQTTATTWHTGGAQGGVPRYFCALVCTPRQTITYRNWRNQIIIKTGKRKEKKHGAPFKAQALPSRLHQDQSFNVRLQYTKKTKPSPSIQWITSR